MGKAAPITLPEEVDPKVNMYMKRVLIVETFKRTKNLTLTAKLVNVTRVTARKWLKRFIQGGRNPFEDAPRSGRPRAITKEQEKQLVRLVANRKANKLHTAAQLQHAAGMQSMMSVRTVRRSLRRVGCHFPGVKKVRRLTERHRTLRLLFSRKYHSKGIWIRTLYTDSTYICINLFKRCWVLEKEKNEQVGDRKPMKIHVYAGISYTGRTQLVFCTGTSQQAPFKKGRRGVGAAEYQERVLPVFLEFGRRMGTGLGWHFVQDGASAHTAKSTKAMLSREIKREWIKDWPPNSADLNPIENVWALLKGALRGKTYQTIDELIVAAKKAWSEIPQRHIRACVGSMWRRLRACVRARGGYIPY